MNILLTGASGFIGGHLLSALVEKFGNDAVTVLTSKVIDNVDCKIYKSLQNFGLDKDVFNNITHVIHAGAFIPKDTLQSNDLSLNFNSIIYTKELLSFEFSNLVRFINLSTVDVYSSTEEKLSEGSLVQPVSLYGSSKLYCEQMVKHFSSQKNVEYINLRIGHVYGPGEEKYKKVLPIAIQNILEDKPLELWGDGGDLRSFIFINDVVESVVKSIDSQAKNIDINVVSGASISIKELLIKLIEISEKPIEIIKRDSNHQKRDLVFDNRLLLRTVLDKETNLLDGLKIEYQYMKEKYENNI